MVDLGIGKHYNAKIDKLEKKMKGLQTTRQYELNKVQKYKKQLDKIEIYIRDFYMHPYSNEVIDIKNHVMEIIHEC